MATMTRFVRRWIQSSEGEGLLPECVFRLGQSGSGACLQSPVYPFSASG